MELDNAIEILSARVNVMELVNTIEILSATVALAAIAISLVIAVGAGVVVDELVKVRKAIKNEKDEG